LLQRFLIFYLLLFTLVAVSACAASGAPSVATSPPAVPPTTAAASTAGQLAALGETAFSTYCAKCHGANGQGAIGPRIIGNNNGLGKYTTGQGLFTKISTTMPQNAPGRLSPDENLQVVTYLLLQNNLVTATDPLGASTLASIAIK
jgi:S-disulfanyl-L-cysteine oxidoreductase SoxD